MPELTVSQLREKINNKLNAAKLRVQKLEEQIQLFDSLLQDDAEILPTEEKKIEETPIVRSKIPVFDIEIGSEEENVGRALTEAIRSAEGNFSVHTIARVIMGKFPDLQYSVVSKKFASTAYRLQKRGEIECVKKGYGRSPHIYKRLNKELENKEETLL